MCSHILHVRQDGERWVAGMWFQSASGATEIEALWALHDALLARYPDDSPIMCHWPRGSGAMQRIKAFLEGS
jgi:hypothetical protein